MTEEITPKRTYLTVGAILIVLTALTYAVSLIDLGPLNTVIALAIAIVKALLIILFFMHARFSKGITRVAIGAGLLWLAIFLVGTLNDYISRGWLGVPGK